MARSSRRLARSLPLLALPLPLRPSLSLFLSPSFFLAPPSLQTPYPVRLDADLGSEFAHVLGHGRRQAREQSTARFGLKPGHPPEARLGAEEGGGGGGGRKPVCSSSFDSAARRGPRSEIFFLSFFFFKERDFFRCLAGGASRVERNCRRLLRGRERNRDRRAGDEGGEEKVKSLLGGPFAFATKNWGLGRAVPGTQGCVSVWS